MAAPGVQNWQAQLLQAIKAPVTPQNMTALDAWQRAEGGAATNNPFNTTLSLPGTSTYNSAGVRNYQTPQQGIDATIQTLTAPQYASGYQPIINALRQGTSPQAVAQAVGSSPWGTSGSLMSQVLGGGGAPSSGVSGLTAPGQPAVPGASPRMPSVAPPAPSLPSPNLGMGVLSGLQSGNLLGGIMGSLMTGGGALPTAKLPGPVPFGGAPSGGPAPKVGTVKMGDPVPARFQTSVGGLHATEGLPGFPAHDFMAPAGSPVVAPVTGTVVKLSGHDPSNGPTEGPHGPFGWSAYIQGQNGRTYYMTHLGSRDVKVGETVRAGTPIGTVGNYAKWTGTPDHIHMGVSAPGVQVS
jgi:murein DD-endopeptidase MepM/ murein hydrolase activator NlpD